MDREKLAKMAQNVRTGGKGTMRRKKKAVHKTTSTDDKRLQNTLKRLSVNTIPGIEEVNIIKDDSIIQFSNPKVQASIAANTYVVSGPSQVKNLSEIQDMLPSLMGGMQNMSPADLAQLQKLAAQYQQQGGMPGMPGMPGLAGAMGAMGAGGDDDDDDDVPDLVQNFDAEAEK